MAKLPTTIEDLACMINEGFTAMQKSIDGLKDDVELVKHIQQDMLDEVNATHEDVRYLRTTVTMLAHTDAAHEAAIESLKTRMGRVEKKVGLAS
jgi:uncharacterized protein YoxC